MDSAAFVGRSALGRFVSQTKDTLECDVRGDVWTAVAAPFPSTFDEVYSWRGTEGRDKGFRYIRPLGHRRSKWKRVRPLYGATVASTRECFV
ncbi:hypothetical protein MRX96_025320 [Rhipicephalus microplus]